MNNNLVFGQKLTFLSLVLFLFLGDQHLDVRYARYAIAILTSLLHRVNSALQRGTNISKSNKVVGFPRHARLHFMCTCIYYLEKFTIFFCYAVLHQGLIETAYNCYAMLIIIDSKNLNETVTLSLDVEDLLEHDNFIC